MTRPSHHRCRPAAIAALAAAGLVVAPASVLAETELYGGFGIGYSTYTVDDLALPGVDFTTEFEGSDYASRQFVGFTWGDYVGAEFGFLNFGTASDTVTVPGPAQTTARVETDGYSLSLVGRYPVNSELVAFAKVGGLRWDSETRAGTGPVPITQDGNGVLAGIGLDFRGRGRVHVRVEGELADIDFADSWWMVTTSLIYSFPVGD